MDEMSGTNFVRGSRKAKLPKKLLFGSFSAVTTKQELLLQRCFNQKEEVLK